MHTLTNSPLGQTTAYTSNYDNSLLFPISRQPSRAGLNIQSSLPFKGYDIWTAFELSWLNKKRKPVVAIADIIVSCDSPNLIESKSFKLYLNSFNNSTFDSIETVRETLIKDLSEAAGHPVEVIIYPAKDFSHSKVGNFEGFYLDELDIACSKSEVNSDLLFTNNERVENYSIYSHLLKSNCPVTGQPDWGSILIQYSGFQINKETLLQYLITYRNHNEFHEQCVERIFMDIMTGCRPDELTVYARYTRRGGLDINPIRSSKSLTPPPNERMYRQ
ncbi:MAG: NADPH-dependent 7-cyano-7-deazaguanine reductase QueF [Tatlockia sp.]|nr:NADPH-dependent 7-cyano-7-deazaguanine reductase QueF [Tatlockia sp.]